MNTYPQFDTRRAEFVSRIKALSPAQLAAALAILCECHDTAPVVQFTREPDEGLLDGCDTDMASKLDEAGFGSGGVL